MKAKRKHSIGKRNKLEADRKSAFKQIQRERDELKKPPPSPAERRLSGRTS